MTAPTLRAVTELIRTVLIFALLFWLRGTVDAQQPSVGDARVPEALTQSAGDFLADVASGDIQAGYEQLLLGGPLEKHLADSSLVEKTQELPKKFGPSRDYELVQSRRVGENLVIVKYLQEFEEFPVVWYITYYRRGAEPREENWVVVAVRFDTDFEPLLTAPPPQP